MCLSSDKKIKEKLSSEYSVRTLVHEYGGRAYCVDKGVIFFINFKDQCLYRQANDSIVALTDGNIRFAELVMTPCGIVAVAESKNNEQIDNFLALIDPISGNVQTLAKGHDFYAAPTLSQDGKKLAWLTWNHPNMSWDETSLWTADWEEEKLVNIQLIAGGNQVSLLQPRWGKDGEIYYLSDHTGWWNLYRQSDKKVDALCPLELEFGRPLWILGMSIWDFDQEYAIAAFQKEGGWHLARIPLQNSSLKVTYLPFQFSDVWSLHVQKGQLICIGSFFDQASQILAIDLKKEKLTSLNQTTQIVDLNGYCSLGKQIEFSSTDGGKAYAFYYPPQNRDYQGPLKDLPPLLVKAHGGPTAQSLSSLNMTIQYWTSRGFAFLDVNYRGSTGYGRTYRESLKKQWGVYDWQDCESGVRYLIEQGWVHPKQIVIDGYSAGGYTVLCALTFGSLFTAGASYFGVSDLTLLAKETHKFEAHYLDQLIGPYPEAKSIYDARSPLQQIDRLNRPVIFFQGKEDRVVPPNQAEIFYDALKVKGLKTELVLYEEEQHGFRQASTIQDSLEKELSFYLQVFKMSDEGK